MHFKQAAVAVVGTMVLGKTEAGNGGLETGLALSVTGTTPRSGVSQGTGTILDHLDRLTPSDKKGKYICPVCGDDNLSVNAEGKYNCFSTGCDTKAIFKAIAPTIEPPTKATRQSQSRSWIYTDAHGNNLIKVNRRDNSDGKRIWQDFWKDGAWRKAKDTPQAVKDAAYANVVPLRWNHVKDGDGPLFLVEGESTADAMRSLGLRATTYIKNSRNNARFFESLPLVLCPDADKPGIKFMEQVAAEYPGAQWAYAMPDHPVWRNLPAGSGIDFADAIKGGATAETVLATIGPARHKLPETKTPAKAAARADRDSAPKASKVAAEVRSKYAGRLAYDSQSEQWVYYGHTKEGLWDRIPDAELESIMQSELDEWPGLEEGYSMGYLSSVVGLLKGRLNRFTWNEQPGLLPFSNGVYDLAQGKLLPHSPGYGFTWQLPRPYIEIEHGADLETICPKIAAAIADFTGGNKALTNILLCWLNAVIKGRHDLQRFLHLVGPGGTGKGSFLRLATALIGETNTHSSSLDVLCQNNYEMANLHGKRLVTFSDEDKYSGRLGSFKAITGGDLLRAEQKHKTAYGFRFTGVAMVASNYPIFAGDTSSGLHRRVLMVPFTKQCPPERRRNLEAEFEPELAALTSYLLGLDDAHVSATLLGVGAQSSEVTELTWEMRMRTDSLAAWLNECVVKRPASEGYYENVGSNKEDAFSLFGSYYQWCQNTGSKPVGLREFSPRLLDLCQNIIGWSDVDRRRHTTGEFKGRYAIDGLKLRTDSTYDPCPIDALVEAVKGEGCGEGSVKARVKAGSPTMQGGEGCEGSETTYRAKNDTPIPDCNGVTERGAEENVLEKTTSDPSLPSLSLFDNGSDPSLHPSLTLHREAVDPSPSFLDEFGDVPSWEAYLNQRGAR